mgnify:CR=1 FL=1
MQEAPEREEEREREKEREASFFSPLSGRSFLLHRSDRFHQEFKVSSWEHRAAAGDGTTFCDTEPSCTGDTWEKTGKKGKKK